jgi:hypothetical protein
METRSAGNVPHLRGHPDLHKGGHGLGDRVLPPPFQWTPALRERWISTGGALRHEAPEITNETNGIRFTQLDRQQLNRIRYQDPDQATPEEVNAA